MAYPGSVEGGHLNDLFLFEGPDVGNTVEIAVSVGAVQGVYPAVVIRGVDKLSVFSTVSG